MVIAAQSTLMQSEQYRADCVRWMTDYRPDIFVTFVFNRRISMDEATRKFEEFHSRLDRRLLGRSYIDRPNERTEYIATIEKPDTNIHIHALFKVTAEQKDRFSELAPPIWNKLVEAGNLDIKSVYCPEGAANYITKELRPHTSDCLLTPPHKEKKNTITV